MRERKELWRRQGFSQLTSAQLDLESGGPGYRARASQTYCQNKLVPCPYIITSVKILRIYRDESEKSILIIKCWHFTRHLFATAGWGLPVTGVWGLHVTAVWGLPVTAGWGLHGTAVRHLSVTAIGHFSITAVRHLPFTEVWNPPLLEPCRKGVEISRLGAWRPPAET